MRQIYDSYVEAKRNNNERTDKIDYETVAKSLKKMVPKLDRKHKGKRVDFKVVRRDTSRYKNLHITVSWNSSCDGKNYFLSWKYR